MPPKQAIRATNEALYSGSQTIVASGVPLNVRLVITEIILQAHSENQAIVYVGNADGQHYPLAASGTVRIAIDETSKVYLAGAEGTIVHWLALGR